MPLCKWRYRSSVLYWLGCYPNTSLEVARGSKLTTNKNNYEKNQLSKTAVMKKLATKNTQY